MNPLVFRQTARFPRWTAFKSQKGPWIHVKEGDILVAIVPDVKYLSKECDQRERAKYVEKAPELYSKLKELYVMSISYGHFGPESSFMKEIEELLRHVNGGAL